MSRLNSIFLEIEQHLHSSEHNSSLLQKGARLTGILGVDSGSETLSDDQREGIREQLARDYVGSNNAGKVFLTNGSVTFKEMSMSMRDMDFRELREDMQVAIYNRLKVPLPLVMSQRQTMNNFSEAKFQLYDFAVLPLADRLFNELTAFLGPRFGLKEDQEITYKQDEIPALQERQTKRVMELNNTGVFSQNEIRAMLGYDRFADGDTIYVDSNKVPAGEDTNLEDNLTKPNARSSASKDLFADLMIEQEKTNGLPINGHIKATEQQKVQ